MNKFMEIIHLFFEKLNIDHWSIDEHRSIIKFKKFTESGIGLFSIFDFDSIYCFVLRMFVFFRNLCGHLVTVWLNIDLPTDHCIFFHLILKITFTSVTYRIKAQWKSMAIGTYTLIYNVHLPIAFYNIHQSQTTDQRRYKSRCQKIPV